MIFRSESGSGILSAATEEWRPFSQKKKKSGDPYISPGLTLGTNAEQ
jgi:hypothetical protein